MKSKVRSVWILLLLTVASGLALADDPQEASEGIRVVSWNISDDSFVSQRLAFQALLLRANPDVLLLDEVAPSAGAEELRKVLAGLQSGQEEVWNIDFGKSGGRQRGVIASRAPLEALPEFSSIVPYPDADRSEILQRMSPADRSNPGWSMDEGIPVNGAVVLVANRRLLVVVADLQCCGNDPGSWHEFRRRVEVREIRKRVRKVLDRTSVDGIVLAGDFNLVSTSIPLVLLTGPYQQPHSGLISAELYHLDGSTTWTWDGRRTPFPSRAMDFQMYGPQALHMRRGYILDTEDLSPEELEQYGLERETSSQLSNHRPLVVEYAWQ